jgi:hypothetical protein
MGIYLSGSVWWKSVMSYPGRSSPANELAGLILAQTNADHPHIDVNLAANHRMIDICPRQYCTLTVAASDTPRGVSFTQQTHYPPHYSIRT